MLELSIFSLLVIPSTAGVLDFVHGQVFQVGHILETGHLVCIPSEKVETNKYRFSWNMFCLGYCMMDGIEKSIDTV